MVCDEAGFNSLYDKLVTNPRQLDTTALSEVLTTLFNSFTCLGVTCDQVGVPYYIIPQMAIDLPVCEDIPMNVTVAGYQGNYDRMLESAVVDLDVLTIGTLVEMEANENAKNVYWWNKFGLSLSQTMYDVSLNDMALAYNHEKNTAAQSYDAKFAIDDLVTSAIQKTGDFISTSSIQRRQVVETLLATIVLPIYALDSLYNAIDTCTNNQIAGEGQHDTTEWDKAAASLVGFLEGPNDGGSGKGALLYNLGQVLCANAGACDNGGGADVNNLLMASFKDGKDQLLESDCTSAEQHVYEIEIYMQTVLLDAVAFYAKRIKDDPTDGLNLANGYALATALYPLVNFGRENDNDSTDTIIESNLGTFGVPGNSEGMDAVIDALTAYATRNNNIDCDVLYTISCEIDSNPVTTVTQSTMTATLSTGDATEPSPAMSPQPSSSTYFPTYLPSVTARPTQPIALEGGIAAGDNGTISSPLYSGAYVPTSNVDNIVNLMGLLEEIEQPGTSLDAGLAFYTQEVEVGLSLQSLSTGSEWNFVTNINPMQIIYMYGLWVSGDGDNDSNGYSNKKFDGGDIAQYGNTIIQDGFKKNSGYDEKLTAETIRVTNVWMAMVTELYKAVESCGDGSASTTEPGFNPVDHAAAFWFGSAKDDIQSVTDGGSLHAWAARAAASFIEQSIGVNDEMLTMLNKLQSNYTTCKDVARDDANEITSHMRKDVLYITRLMTIPIVQNFITDLATKSGKAPAERDYLILYSLALLPQLSICDEDVLDTLFTELVLENASFNNTKFSETIKAIQDRYDCLGISCSLVGTSTYSDKSWPSCVDHADPSVILSIAGYEPFSKASSELSKIDLDVSTILSFIVMEANDAAFEVYKTGRNVIGNSGSYISILDLKVPSNPTVISWYSKFNGDYGVNYLWLTESAIRGVGNFVSTTPLQNSAAASVALATMDLHLAILENLYQAVQNCRDGSDPLVVRALWDRAVALTVGWTEGQSEFGSQTDGYLFFQLAQEVCKLFNSCDSDGNSEINNRLLTEFNNGVGIISLSECDSLEEHVGAIETLLQTIVLDNLAYHIDSAESDDRNYLLAHCLSYAIMPFMRSVDEPSADVLERNLGTFPTTIYLEDGKEAVYSALKAFVDAKGIDCDLLGSSICAGITSSDADSVASPNDTGLTLANGEYTPFTDVTNLTAGLSSVTKKICNAQNAASAKNVYTDDETAGFTLQSLSLTAKDVMSNEVLFNQFVYAFFDEVDKTDGSLLFDGSPAVEYGNTIVSDAVDNNIALGCVSVKVLIMWMWVVHKLNQSIEECKAGDPEKYGSIDEAAAVWIGNVSASDEGGLLYEMAEELGGYFSQKDGDYMTTLNSEIISRLNLAQTTFFVNNTRCKSDGNAVKVLRKLVNEIVSYMTAVIIQGLIHSMLEENNAKDKATFVELYYFAFLPHIARCGHDGLKDSLYNDLVVGNFNPFFAPDVIDSIHSQLNCLGLQCEDIGRHILADESYPECLDNVDLLGYTPANGTRTNMPARLDLDAVAIHQLMSMEKYSLAREIYLNGLNYYDYDNEAQFGFVSFHNLTQSATIGNTDFDTYELYNEYLSKNPGDFVDEFILDSFDNNDKFNGTTAKQRELAVSTAIKLFVSYMSALEALNVAVSNCETNTPRALTAWDGGTALLIGSVEGTESGTNTANSTKDGRMFYSVSNALCDHFDTCTQDGSAVSDDLLALLTQGQGYIYDKSCPDVTSTLKSIVQLCAVSLIQSALYFADESSDEDNLAAGYIASMAVLPIVDKIDPDAATAIKREMRFRPSSIDSNSSAVFDAFRTMLSNPQSDIDCEMISNIDRLCDAPDAPASINPDEPSVISDGLYVATNFVTDRSYISLDISDITDKIKSDLRDQAVDLYKNGANSPTYNANGQLIGKRSISRFSTDSANNMTENPVYNLFLIGLADENYEFIGRPVTTYADSFVMDLLYSNDRQKQLAAPNAMVVLNIWMEVVQKMYSAYNSCKSTLITNGRRLEGGEASLFIDEAAAYWIGDSQETGSSSQGHLLYALTEFLGEKFEDIPQGSQSSINTRIIDLINQAKSHISITKSCSTSPTSHSELRNIIEELVPLMAVPLLRGLFYYLSIRDSTKTKLYALSVLPLFSTCSKSTFLELKSDLIDSYVVDVEKDYVFSRIQSMYDCLGLSCDMVGFMPRNNFTHCQESATNKQLAGFSYVGDHDSFGQHSKIDVDIKDIEAFIDNGLDIFPTDNGLGKDFYQFQQYSSSYASVQGLAKSSGREVVPSFASFRRYFNDDVNYADSIIVDAFQQEGVYATATSDVRRRAISFTMRYMVTYMAALEKLYTTINLCTDSNKSEAYESLDAAAAYIIGSSEGTQDGGSYDGVLLFMLAKRLCVHFKTCSSSNNAESNERIISLLYAAQGEIDVGACDSLAKTVRGIENTLVIPLIQGTLFTALQNDLFINKVIDAGDYLAEGQVLAQCILPLIHDVDPSAANDIESVMVDGFPNHAKVFRAMGIAIPKMKGLDCNMVGILNGISFCSGAETTNSGPHTRKEGNVLVALGLSFLVIR
eukprot:CCRYP_005898-RB/>CCRYP_005898-RB protein AED:0.02 eAED:0.02 QI:1433/1/1/1/0.93/0.88/17/82/2547